MSFILITLGLITSLKGGVNENIPVIINPYTSEYKRNSNPKADVRVYGRNKNHKKSSFQRRKEYDTKRRRSGTLKQREERKRNIIEEEKKRVPALAARATEQLTAGLSKHPFIGDIRISGLMIGIECVTDKAQKTPHPDLTGYILKECLKRNLIVLSCGIHHNVIRLAPPLIISDEELQTGLQTLIEVIHDYH